MTYCVIKCKKKSIAPHVKLVRDNKKFDEMKYKEAINRVQWHSCNIFDEVDDNLWMMEKLYKEVPRENIPKRRAKIRSKSLPWMNSKKRKLMNRHTEGKQDTRQTDQARV